MSKGRLAELRAHAEEGAELLVIRRDTLLWLLSHAEDCADLEQRLAVAVEALEEIADGNGCNARYGPGCDHECKRLAGTSLSRIGAGKEGE